MPELTLLTNTLCIVNNIFRKIPEIQLISLNIRFPSVLLHDTTATKTVRYIKHSECLIRLIDPSLEQLKKPTVRLLERPIS